MATANALGAAPGGRVEIGVRPEFVRFSAAGIPVHVVRVSDIGRHKIVETRHGGTAIRLLLEEQASVPSEHACVSFDPAHTHLYVDGWLAGRGAA